MEMVEKRKPTYYIIAPSRSKKLEIQKIIHNALNEIGFERIEFLWRPARALFISIKNAIDEADIIIADLTDFNPNVMYELGFAHAIRKPTLLIVKRGLEGLPSDIGGNFFIVYDPDDPDYFKKAVRNFALKYKYQKERRENRHD